MVSDSAVIFGLLSFLTVLSTAGAIWITRETNRLIKESRESITFPHLEASFDLLRELRAEEAAKNAQGDDQ